MKRYIFAILTVALAIGARTEARAWDRNAHAAIAYIAECNLTPQAKANVEACIGGNSIVYYSSWLDHYRNAYKEWADRTHTCDYDYATHRPVGVGAGQLKEYVENLKDYRNLTDSARLFNIYALVHILGDFHCPGHSYFVKEGQKMKIRSSFYQVRVFGEEKRTNYHALWDTRIMRTNHYDWGYTEYARILDCLPQAEKDAVVAGTIDDWLLDIADTSAPIYEWFDHSRNNKKDEIESLPDVDRRRMNEYGDIACRQIERAGLRLAKLLNELFAE